ncbi:MAG: hypothetical protein M3416_01230 [Acidobacteriota bacterium]|nr:hypothetical protein [Acidobacteriota bacterium]
MSPSGFIDPIKFRLAFTHLESLTSRIWTLLRYSQEYEVSHGEETIIDVTLLDLRMIVDRLKLVGIDVWKCAEGWEPHIGTDWMRYVGSPSRGWLRFAVQAKKLHLGSSLYKSLGHEVRPGLRQLLHYAAFENRATRPRLSNNKRRLPRSCEGA